MSVRKALMLVVALFLSASQIPCRAADQDPKPIPYVYKTVDIPKLGLLVGKQIDSKPLDEIGVHVRLLDQKTVRTDEPIVLSKGEALYLYVGGKSDTLTGVDVVDANGSTVMKSPTAFFVTPVEEAKAVVSSYPLNRPLDDTMTLRLKFIPNIQLRSATIHSFRKLQGKKIADPLLSALGIAVEIVAIRTGPGGSSNVAVRISGPAELLSLMPEPSVELPSGCPWAIIANPEDESPTSKLYDMFVAPDSSFKAELKLTVLLPADTPIPPSREEPPYVPAPLDREATAKKAAVDKSPATIDRLISKLSDDDGKTRDIAEEKLWQIGAPALAALKKSADDPSPETQMRARRLARAMELPPLPATGNWRTRMASFGKTLDASQFVQGLDGECQVAIRQDADGIRMSVCGRVVGGRTAQHFSAKSADVLRHQAPEAYALYQHWCTPLNPAHRRWLDAKTNTQIAKAMAAANVPADKQKEVMKQLDVIGDAEGYVNENIGDDGMVQEKDLNTWYAETDKLRDMLKDLKLSIKLDPKAFPHSHKYHLGIFWSADPAALKGLAASGLRITAVEPRSRAEAMGLKTDDVIQKVGPHEIRKTDDMHDAIDEYPTKLTIEVVRDGKKLTLEEK